MYRNMWNTLELLTVIFLIFPGDSPGKMLLFPGLPVSPGKNFGPGRSHPNLYSGAKVNRNCTICGQSMQDSVRGACFSRVLYATVTSLKKSFVYKSEKKSLSLSFDSEILMQAVAFFQFWQGK